MAVDAPPQLGADANPIPQPDVDEAAGLGRPLHLVEASQVPGCAAGFAEAGHRAKLEIAGVDQPKGRAIAWRAEPVVGLGGVEAEGGRPGYIVVVRALVGRRGAHIGADGDHPFAGLRTPGPQQAQRCRQGDLGRGRLQSGHLVIPRELTASMVHGHDGWVADGGVDFVYSSNKFDFSVGPRIGYGDNTYNQTYFGVTQVEADRSPYVNSTYDPGAGRRYTGVMAGVAYHWDKHWKTDFSAGYQRIADHLTRSPVIQVAGERDQYTAGVGMSYSFTVGHP